MNFNWFDFMSLGESLLESGREEDPINESKIRTAISRIYYAVFGTSRKHYTDEYHVRFSYDETDHKTLVLEMESRKGSGVSNNLNRLRRTRNQADYNEVLHGDIINTAEMHLSRARHVLSKHSLLPP